jgi:hypothetical protein
MFSKKSQISNFIKIRPVEAALFHKGRQADRLMDGTDARTDMMKLTVAFRKFCERAYKKDLKGEDRKLYMILFDQRRHSLPSKKKLWL